MAVLKIAYPVILPFTIAVLLAFVFIPMIKTLNKIRCPRILSIFIVIIIIAAGMSIFGMVLFSSGRMVVMQMPNFEGRFKEIYDWMAEVFSLPNDEGLTFWQNLWGQEIIRNLVRDITISSSSTFFSFISIALLVVLFAVFILMEAGFFKEKLFVAFESQAGNIEGMGNELVSQVTRYLTAKFLISFANGLIFVIAFSIIGLEFAVVWGVFQFLLNFIPTLGSITAGVIISLFALLQFWPDPAPIILIVAIILGVNMICNFLDPKIVGDHVGISPLVILVSLSLWGYIWGFAGMVLAVPMTVIIKIVCEHIPIMEPVSVLIGSRKSVLVKKAAKEKAESEEAQD